MIEAAIDRRTFLSGSASLLLCGSATAQSADQAARLRTYAFEKAQWFDGADFRSGTFYSRNGTLTLDRPRSVDETIDLSGKYVVPPFAEAHNHNVEPRPKLEEVIRRVPCRRDLLREDSEQSTSSESGAERASALHKALQAKPFENGANS